MKKTLLFFLLFLPTFAFGQTVSGTITASTCLQVNVYGKGTVGIVVTNSGTAWSGTIQPQVIVENDPNGTAGNAQVTPSTSSTAQATITSNATYFATVAGATYFQVCGNTVTNTAAIKLTAIPLAANRNAGTGNGNVTGAASSTTQGLSVFSDTTGKVLADSGNFACPYAADTGAANTLTVTVNGFPAAIVNGLCVRVKVLNNASGATTLNVTPTGQSAYGAIAVMKRINSGVAAIANSADINAGGIYEFFYDGTQWVLGTPSSTVYAAGALGANKVILGNSNNQVQASTATFTSGVLKSSNTQLLTADSASITATTAATGTVVFTWGALPVSQNFSWHCSGTYTQATAAGGVSIAVQGATNAPTRIDAWASLDSTNPASTTYTGTKAGLANLTTTTATLVAAVTPGAITTQFQWAMEGVVQNGASATTLNIIFFSASASDAVVVKAGSYCTLLP